MSPPSVSVIIPCFNGERFLRQVLQSISFQTDPNWECIVIDDGSTDRSAAIAEEFVRNDSRFRLHRQANAGLARSRNAGTELARGDLIQFLDADDLLLPTRFETCMGVFASHPDVDAVYTDYVCYRKSRGYYRDLPARMPYEDAFRSFLIENSITFAAVVHGFMFRARVVRENPFDPSQTLAEDVECWTRMAANGMRFYFVDEILSIYRMTEGSITWDEARLYRAKCRMLASYREHARIRGLEQELERALQHYRERLAIGYFMEGRYRDGLEEAKQVWSKASVRSRAKIAGWGVLLSFLSRRRVVGLRDWLMRHNMWGPSTESSKNFTWTPPASLRPLVEV